MPYNPYNLGSINAIPLGEGRNYVVEGAEVAVFNTRAGVYATQADCPHRNGPLADGLIGGATVLCPFHAWKFDLTTGKALMGQCDIRTYPVALTPEGDILLHFDGPPEPSCEMPADEQIGISQAPVGSAAGPAETAAAR